MQSRINCGVAELLLAPISPSTELLIALNMLWNRVAVSISGVAHVNSPVA
jgi:hypothetical protein